MSREWTRREFLAAGGAASTVALAGCGGNGVGGGGGGTDWYYAESNRQLSEELVSFVNTRDDRDITLREGGTAPDALKRLNNGTGEFAVVGADVVSFAQRGAGMAAISSSYENIRAMMSLYPMPVTLVARPDIEAETLGDLSDATVNVGEANGRLAASANQVLNNSEADYSTTNLGLSDAVSRLGDGSLDVTFAVGDWPIPAVQEAAPDIEILEIRDEVQAGVVGSTNWFVRSQLPAGVYEGIDHTIPTLGIMTLLMTRDEADEGTVAVVTNRVLKSARDGDIKTHGSYIPTMDNKDQARVGIPDPVDLHDGAQQVIIYTD